MKRLFSSLFIVIAAVVLWAEEWLWEFIKLLSALVAKLPLIRWYEGTLARLPPYAALLALLVPGLFLLPLKLLGLWLMSSGHAFFAVAVIIAAKVLGTAIVTRTFVICKPRLMTLSWFERLYGGFISLRERVYARLRALPLYQSVRAALTAARAWVRKVTRKLLATGSR